MRFRFRFRLRFRVRIGVKVRARARASVAVIPRVHRDEVGLRLRLNPPPELARVPGQGQG